MTAVVDIACPECGRTDSIVKEGIGAYRCTECDVRFDRSDVVPGEP